MTLIEKSSIRVSTTKTFDNKTPRRAPAFKNSLAPRCARRIHDRRVAYHREEKEKYFGKRSFSGRVGRGKREIWIVNSRRGSCSTDKLRLCEENLDRL